MVRGLNVFADFFRGFEQSYVLIGGAACDTWMESVGSSFRATKDLDIVIVVESLSTEFVERFWAFCREGGYGTRERSSGRKILYRFAKPSRSDFPYMIETFSRSPFDLPRQADSRLTPIPAGDDVASLSAILMDEEYYGLVNTTKTRDNALGIPLIPPVALIPLKAKAWLDLTARKTAGESIDEKHIRKHRNDVLRLAGVLTETDTVTARQAVAADMKEFLAKMGLLGTSEWNDIGKAVGQTLDQGTALNRLSNLLQTP